jgi:hypothetical protein
MKLIIELTNGKVSVCGDCECVAEMASGLSTREELEKEFGIKMPNYHFEE